MSVKAEGAGGGGGGGVCETCLARGRRLARLHSLRRELLAVLPAPDADVENMHICWECRAVLTKIQQFKLRAGRAQEWLQWAHAQKDTTLFQLEAVTVSSLRTCIKPDYDVEIDFETQTITNLTDSKAVIPEVLPAEFAFKDVVVSKMERVSDTEDFDYESMLAAAASPDLDKDFIKMEPVDADAIFADLPLSMLKKKSKKSKITKKVRSKVKREKAEKVHDTERKKRAKANPFDAYKVISVSRDDVLRQREEECKNVWYLKSPYKCESCIYGFRSESQYNKHLFTNHSPDAGGHVCEICATRTPNARELDKHMRKHYERYVCNVCGLTFSRIHTMRQHHTKLHKARKCKHCGLEFYELHKLLVHRKTLHLEYQCDKCGKKTTSRHMLKKHLRTHDPYPCSQCDMIFTSKKNLDQHVRNRHETRPSEAYCVECNKQFASRPSYLLHVTEKHSQQVRFRCPVCEKPFNRKIYMKNHYNLMHLKKTNYYCKICDKYICRKDGLRKHIEFVHEGKRLPKNKMCDICGRGFATNKTLINHRRTHTGERPHQCEYCTAAFAQITALKTHVKHIHLQIKRGHSTHAT